MSTTSPQPQGPTAPKPIASARRAKTGTRAPTRRKNRGGQSTCSHTATLPSNSARKGATAAPKPRGAGMVTSQRSASAASSPKAAAKGGPGQRDSPAVSRCVCTAPIGPPQIHATPHVQPTPSAIFGPANSATQTTAQQSSYAASPCDGIGVALSRSALFKTCRAILSSAKSTATRSPSQQSISPTLMYRGMCVTSPPRESSTCFGSCVRRCALWWLAPHAKTTPS